jgi:hypothetical protein
LVVALNSVASFTGRGNSKNMDCARHKQICMCLPHPPCARTIISAVFKKHYKTAEIYSRKFLMLTICQPECNVEPSGILT